MYGNVGGLGQREPPIRQEAHPAEEWSTCLGRAARYATTKRTPSQSDAPADIGVPPESWACGCAATYATEPDPGAPNRSGSKSTANSLPDMGRS
jgi:hypothetical protein